MDKIIKSASGNFFFYWITPIYPRVYWIFDLADCSVEKIQFFFENPVE